jgi:hypothetical protein
MVCTQCGQTVREGVRFCPNCGATQQTSTPKEPSPLPVAESSPPPAAKEPRRPIPIKTLMIIGLVGFVLFAGIILAGWFYFFPPGVYVRDSFRKAHKELAGSLKGVNATFSDGVAHLRPPNQKFYVLLYETPASNQATIEGTAIWKEGDEETIFGVVCCAVDENNFTALMIGAKGDYLVNTFTNGEWYDLTGFLRFPKEMKLQKDTPYKIKLVTEGDYISAYLNETLLIRMLDAYQHNGRVGVYAQGGKVGGTDIGFDEFKAKKNSLFQKEKKE